MGLPLALETFRITASHPEFRFFEVNCFGACVHSALDALAKKLSIIGPRAHVVNVAPVADLISQAICLPLIFVIDPVELAVEIILIAAPGNPGHDVNPVTMLAPGLHAFRQVRPDAVRDRHIRAQIARFAPGLAGLKTGSLEDLTRIGRERIIYAGRTRKFEKGNRESKVEAQKHRRLWMTDKVAAFNDKKSGVVCCHAAKTVSTA